MAHFLFFILCILVIAQCSEVVSIGTRPSCQHTPEPSSDGEFEDLMLNATQPTLSSSSAVDSEDIQLFMFRNIGPDTIDELIVEPLSDVQDTDELARFLKEASCSDRKRYLEKQKRIMTNLQNESQILRMDLEEKTSLVDRLKMGMGDKAKQMQHSQNADDIYLPKWILFIVIGGTGAFLILIIAVISSCWSRKSRAERGKIARKPIESLSVEAKLGSLNTTNGLPIISMPIDEWKSTKMTQKGPAEKSDDDNEDLFDEGWDENGKTSCTLQRTCGSNEETIRVVLTKK